MPTLGSRLPRPTIFMAAACLMMIGLQSWTEWGAYKTQVRETETSLANLASSLAQHAEDTVEVADTAVIGVVTLLESKGTAPEVPGGLGQKLAAQVSAGTRFQDIVVCGVNGDWLATSAATQQGTCSGRGYFNHHRDDPDRGAYVGQPIQSRLNGKWVITVSRRFQSPDGGFAGVVVAIIELSSFAGYYATYDLGPGGVISLSATDGTLLARYPASTSFVGQDVSAGQVFSEMRKRSSGSYANVAIIDGVRRFSGYRKSERYPLVVVAAMSQDEALSGWRRDAGVDMAVALALTLGVGFLGLSLTRQVWRSQAAERRMRAGEASFRLQAENLRQANERITLATGGGAIGIWDWDVSHDRMAWDPWMHRQPPGQAVRDGRAAGGDRGVGRMLVMLTPSPSRSHPTTSRRRHSNARKH